jgi:hypothetical protein
VSSIQPSPDRNPCEAASKTSSNLWSRLLPHIAVAVPDVDDGPAWSLWKQAACAQDTLPEPSP